MFLTLQKYDCPQLTMIRLEQHQHADIRLISGFFYELVCSLQTFLIYECHVFL